MLRREAENFIFFSWH